MISFHRVRLRLRALVRRRTLEHEMQEEMREHLDRTVQRLIARGVSPANAHAAARREFGNVPLIQEQARDARGMRWIDELRGDLRFAFRYFASRPLTTAAIVSVLALGIGANTVTFTVLQAFTTRPAPGVPKNDAHVRIYGLERSTRAGSWRFRNFSYPEIAALTERRATFEQVAAWVPHEVVLTTSDTSTATGVGAEFVTPNFFKVLGTRLAAGIGFSRTDLTTPDFSAVISYRAAEERFGSPTAAIGQKILVNGVGVQIGGVAPRRFQGAVRNNSEPTLWLPLSARADIARMPRRWLDAPTLSVFASLAPKVTRNQAAAIAGEVAARAIPDSLARLGGTFRSEVIGIRDSPPSLGSDDDGTLLIISAAAVSALLILIVACTNVSSLLVASAIARRHEIAVRLSLGASRGRLLRQLLTESALLSLAGGTLGLLLYWWTTTIFASRGTSFGVEIAPDLSTVLFTATFAVGTGILLGLSPALHATNSGVATALRDSGTGMTRRSRLQRAFVVAQIMFSQPLLLMLATVIMSALPKTRPMRAGVREHVVFARFRLPPNASGAAQPRNAVDSLAARLAVSSGVTGVVPEANTFDVRTLIPPKAPTGSTPKPTLLQIEGTAPGYFALLGIPIVLGRDIVPADTAGSDYNVVIDTDLAREFWGTEIPVGKTITSVELREGVRDSVAIHVVGVYDAALATTRGRAGRRMYSAAGRRWRNDALLIHTSGPAESFVPTLRTIIRAEAPYLPVDRLETLAQVEERNRNLSFSVATGLGSAGGVGLLLASLGLYSVIALAVRQRRREIGIRLALGAVPARVAYMFLASGMRLAAIGLLFGLPFGFALVKLFLANAMIGAELLPTALCIGVVMLLIASAATWIPARQAARLDPAMTLRTE